MSWLENIRQWLIDNQTEILAVLTFIQSSGLVGIIVGFVKSIKKIKDNTDNTKKLNTSIESVDALKEEIVKLQDVNTKLIEKCEHLENQNNDIQNSVDTLLTKVDAMIEVQSVVYTTIKDDKTRATVNNLLTNAKYAVTAQRAKLLEELDNLRKQVKEYSDKAAALVEHTVNKAQSIVKADDKETSEEVVTRY